MDKYQIFLQWNKEGDWLPTVWNLEYWQACRKMYELSFLHEEHNYKIMHVSHASMDTPLAEQYGG